MPKIIKICEMCDATTETTEGKPHEEKRIQTIKEGHLAYRHRTIWRASITGPNTYRHFCSKVGCDFTVEVNSEDQIEQERVRDIMIGHAATEHRTEWEAGRLQRLQAAWSEQNRQLQGEITKMMQRGCAMGGHSGGTWTAETLRDGETQFTCDKCNGVVEDVADAYRRQGCEVEQVENGFRLVKVAFPSWVQPVNYPGVTNA